jgi:hypothetical protein
MGQVFKVPALPYILNVASKFYNVTKNIVLTAVILQQLLKDMFCNIQTHFLLCEACVCYMRQLRCNN